MAGAIVEPEFRISQEARPTAAVHCRRLRRAFGEREVISELSIDIMPGEFVALLGRSGSGKSTFLRALAGLDAEIEGDLKVAERRAVVFQDARLIPWKRVRANVALGVRGSGTAERVRRVLEEVGLSDHSDAWPATLSGGEGQRVALARALAREPDLLLLDEPFGALDALTRLKMHGLLRKLCARYRPAVLLVTHDVDEAIMLAERIVVLDDGRIGLDVQVDVPKGNNCFETLAIGLRTRLLHELGVHDDRA
ncbi:ABC transporter ATP-binding protein [Marinivivus vitaminiproducens]|uniref:ABC transporter ATP-binding protein n=1 Tax=Marinivivus vitaminiproducens TaxID=3035935 RepID=UPI00279CA3B8|nr:ABC transporter ATP-binding protein [Geminicoccaceae bacterium SCSIO 64248]